MVVGVTSGVSRVKVLVTGGNGQLGHELQRVFADHEVLAIDIDTVDITDRDAIFSTITSFEPEVVLHGAALTAVDACEEQPALAFRVNSLATRFIADASARVGARICYVSTDYVFDGTKVDPYVEWDLPNPMSVYGRSKLGGEREVYPGSLIVRTSWVCGAHGNNMVKTALRLAQGDGEVRFVDDQRGHPTFAADLAEGIHRLVVGHHTGLFHVTNQGAVSWYEFVREIFELAGADDSRVMPISTAELDPPRPAPRPANSVLDNSAMRDSGVALLPDHRASLEVLVRRLLA